MKIFKSLPFSMPKKGFLQFGLLLILSAALAIPSGAAYAAGSAAGNPASSSQPNGSQDKTSLTQALQNANAQLAKLQTKLTDATNSETTLENLISQASAAGQDTTALSNALAAIQTDVSTASSALTTAASLLSSHDGFDDSGNVTDEDTATQTIQSAQQALQQAQTALNQATQTLREAEATYNQQANTSNTQQVTPQATPQVPTQGTPQAPTQVPTQGTPQVPTQAPTQGTPSGTPGDPSQNKNLQDNFQNMKDRLGPQESTIETALALVDKVKKLIADAKAEGLDTSDLSAALRVFEDKLDRARDYHNKAGNFISAFNGFDANGNVTNQPHAQQTVNGADQYLTSADDALKQAIQDLKNAVNAWEEANRSYFELGRAYQQAKTQLANETANYKKAYAVISNIQAFITKAKDNDQDTTALSKALSAYKSQLSKAKKYISTASNALSTHSGFDSKGRVTNRTKAAATLKTANEALANAQKALSQAASDLQAAFQPFHH